MAVTLDVAAFRAQFPAFADQKKYPDAMIEAWFNTALAYVDAELMLTPAQQTQAVYLMTAHMMQLATVAQAQAADGSTGAPTGPVQSASEGSVSVSFVTPPATSGLEYWLSSTPYGVQLWALLRIAAAGGLYVGGLPERTAFRKVGGTFR